MSDAPSPLNLCDLLPAAHILLPGDCRNKKRAFEIAAGKLADLTGLAGKELFRQFMQRERQGSTAIGGGGAIPHVLADIPQPRCLLMRLAEPIAYDDDDADERVDTLFFLIAPAGANAAHLHLLSLFSHILTDDALMARLAQAAAEQNAAAAASAIADWQQDNRAMLDAISDAGG